MMYRCDLINGDVVAERFFREGASAQEVREQLEQFQWPEGEWRITAINDDGKGEE